MTAQPAPGTPWPPTREEGLRRLAGFVPRAGHDYAANRGYDDGAGRHTHVSTLSPYLRHRLITEREVVAAVLDAHSASAADKFVSEVFWRTYFKGWLALRPVYWDRFQVERDALLDRVRGNAGLRDAHARAEEGRTGIGALDHWSRELETTGYLHNHARMWFASIWIFTLGLPWQLGADLFLRRLIDGDPASNTLSWRWVAGLHTRGKTYAADAGNIERYTRGRLKVEGLARSVAPIEEDETIPDPRALPLALDEGPDADVLLLLHEDDLALESLPLGQARVRGTVLMRRTERRSPLPVSEPVDAFLEGAMADTEARVRAAFSELPLTPAVPDADSLIAAAREAEVETILLPNAPTGPIDDALAEMRARIEAAGLTLACLRRTWDDEAWPHATKGFFAIKKRIPHVLHAEGLGPEPKPEGRKGKGRR